MCQVKVDEYLDWPNCQIHYDLTTKNSDFYSWVWDSMGDPHGPIHLWLGGVMDCKSMYNKIGSLVGPDIAAVLAFLGVGHRRSLFCEGVWSCEGDKVTVDVKPEEVSRRPVYRKTRAYCLLGSVCSSAELDSCSLVRRRNKSTVSGSTTTRILGEGIFATRTHIEPQTCQSHAKTRRAPKPCCTRTSQPVTSQS